MRIDFGWRFARRAAPLALLLGLLAGPALAAFDPPQTLSAPGQDALNPQVAVTPAGNAVVVWRRSNGPNTVIQARSRSASGALGPVQTLSASGQNATDPQVAVSAAGVALIVWTRSDGTFTRVQARSRSAAGKLGPVQTLSPPFENAEDPRVAVAPNGRAIVIWGLGDSIQARAGSAGGAFGAVQTLSVGDSPVFRPVVDIADNGVSVAGWLRDERTFYRVQARARSASGALGAVQAISPTGKDAFHVDLAVDATGDALFVWQSRTSRDAQLDRIAGRARSAAGALRPLQDLSALGDIVAVPEVAMQGDGDAIVVWKRDDRIETRNRSAAGALGPVQAISPAVGFADIPQVAYADNGIAAFVWTYTDEAFGRSIQARSRLPSGALGPIQEIGDIGSDFGNPQIAIGRTKAIAVWEGSSGSFDSRIQASEGP